jgi:serine/threonine protein phosphatase PrpC
MKYYGLTDRGKLRRSNQDSYIIASSEEGDVFAMVCDGIGGGQGGDVASRMATEHFSRAFAVHRPFADGQDLQYWLQAEIQAVNQEIHETGSQHLSLKGMGTTLTGVLLTTVGSFIVNVGDSRTYAYDKNGSLQLLTRDDSLVNEMLAKGELTPEEAENYPRRNVLTKALGVWDHVKPAVFPYEGKADGFLLCSDGLHGYVSEEEISGILGDPDTDPALRVRRLFNAAMHAGGFDNITMILVEMGKEDRHGE